MDRKVLIDFLKLMKVDLCLLFFIFGFMMQNVTVIQLMEDKMCLNQLQMDRDFCLKLTTDHYNETQTKSILRKANMFKNYQFMILNGPALVLSIFLGYWLGNYPKYIRFMVIFPLVTAAFMDVLLLINCFAFSAHWWIILLSYIPVSLAGGTCLIFSAAYTYISWSTPNKLVIVRFAIIEFVVQVGILMATFVGGKVLSMDPWIKSQPKNYTGVFFFSLISHLIGVLVAYLMVLEFTPKTDSDKDKFSFIDVLSDVFQVTRFKQPAAIFLKKRPFNGRLRLTLLITSGAISLGAILGEDGIAYQFAQRVYGLTEDQYTSMFALVTIIPSILTSIGPSLFRSFLGLSDSTMAIIGSLSLLFYFLIRGVFLSLPGYIAGYLLGSFNRLANASVRTLITAVVDPAESAQVFTLATALENYISLGSTFLYTSVFSITIDRSPGTILVLMACFQLYPLTVFCWSYFTRSTWQQKKSIDLNTEITSTNGPAIIETVMTSVEVPKNVQTVS